MVDEYLDFIKTLPKMYLEQWNIDRILASIDVYTSWIGMGRQEIDKIFTEASQALLREKKNTMVNLL